MTSTLSVATAGPVPAGRRVGVAYLATRVLGQGAEFVGFVVLARRLGAGELGLLWIPLLITRYLGLLGDWGATLRGARDVAARIAPADLVALVRRREVVTGALTVAFLGGATVYDVRLAPLAACIVARGLSRDWMQLGSGSGGRAGAASVVQGAGLVLGALAVSTLAAGAMVIGGASLLGLAVSLHLNPLPPVEPGDGHAPVDGLLLSGSLADQVALTADSFLLAGLIGAHAAGIYGAVYRLPNAGTTVVGLLSGVLIARMAAVVRDDPARGPAELRRALRASGAAALALVALAPLAAVAVVPVFGEEYRSGASAAAILVLALAVVCAGAPLHAAVLAAHRDRAYVRGLAGAAVVNVTANLVLIPPLELTGAALATLLGSMALVAHLAVVAR